MLKHVRSFGPRIRLTERQEAQLVRRLNQAGLQCCVENCWTGSCYITISQTVIDHDIHGDPYESAGEQVAKIRISGHDVGRWNDSTHRFVGSKSACMNQLAQWVDDLLHSRPTAQPLS